MFGQEPAQRNLWLLHEFAVDHNVHISFCLIFDGFHHLFMAVAKGVGGHSGYKVQVAISVLVIQVTSFSPCYLKCQWMFAGLCLISKEVIFHL